MVQPVIERDTLEFGVVPERCFEERTSLFIECAVLRRISVIYEEEAALAEPDSQIL